MYLIALGAGAAVLLVNATWGRRAPMPPPPGDFAEVAGRRIHYVERPGTEPAVVLLHGMPGTHLDYERVVPQLGAARVIAIDRPGYGWSIGGHLSYEGQVEMVPELLAALGLERAVLAGHSFGGLLALGVAARHPDVVASLALLAPSGGGLRSGPVRKATARLVRTMQRPGMRQLSELTVGGIVRRVGAIVDARFAFAPDPVDHAYASRLNAVTLQDGNLRAMAEDRLAYDARIAWVDSQVPQLDTPAVMLLARGDQPIPIRHGRALAEALRGSEVREVEGGHMLPVVQPTAVAAAIGRARELAATAAARVV